MGPEQHVVGWAGALQVACFRYQQSHQQQQVETLLHLLRRRLQELALVLVMPLLVAPVLQGGLQEVLLLLAVQTAAVLPFRLLVLLPAGRPGEWELAAAAAVGEAIVAVEAVACQQPSPLSLFPPQQQPSLLLRVMQQHLLLLSLRLLPLQSLPYYQLLRV